MTDLAFAFGRFGDGCCEPPCTPVTHLAQAAYESEWINQDSKWAFNSSRATIAVADTQKSLTYGTADPHWDVAGEVEWDFAFGPTVTGNYQTMRLKLVETSGREIVFEWKVTQASYAKPAWRFRAINKATGGAETVLLDRSINWLYTLGSYATSSRYRIRTAWGTSPSDSSKLAVRWWNPNDYGTHNTLCVRSDFDAPSTAFSHAIEYVGGTETTPPLVYSLSKRCPPFDNTCSCTNGLGPNQWQLEISGFTGGYSFLNGTWIAENVSALATYSTVPDYYWFGASPCNWSFEDGYNHPFVFQIDSASTLSWFLKTTVSDLKQFRYVGSTYDHACRLGGPYTLTNADYPAVTIVATPL